MLGLQFYILCLVGFVHTYCFVLFSVFRVTCGSRYIFHCDLVGYCLKINLLISRLVLLFNVKYLHHLGLETVSIFYDQSVAASETLCMRLC